MKNRCFWGGFLLAKMRFLFTVGSFLHTNDFLFKIVLWNFLCLQLGFFHLHLEHVCLELEFLS